MSFDRNSLEGNPDFFQALNGMICYTVWDDCAGLAGNFYFVQSILNFVSHTTYVDSVSMN